MYRNSKIKFLCGEFGEIWLYMSQLRVLLLLLMPQGVRSPLFKRGEISNHFRNLKNAFKLTFHHPQRMLKSARYVRCISEDFSPTRWQPSSIDRRAASKLFSMHHRRASGPWRDLRSFLCSKTPTLLHISIAAPARMNVAFCQQGWDYEREDFKATTCGPHAKHLMIAACVFSSSFLPVLPLSDYSLRWEVKSFDCSSAKFYASLK